jgi:hypothetical protein
VSYPRNPATALAPRTWLPGGVAVPPFDGSPPSPPVPTPNTGDVFVVGAGSSVANSTYVPTDTFNGRTRAYSSAGLVIFWTGTQWNLQQGGTVLYRSFDPEVNPNPDSVAWSVVDGVAPAPSVSIAGSHV